MTFEQYIFVVIVSVLIIIGFVTVVRLTELLIMWYEGHRQMPIDKILRSWERDD